MINYEFSLLKLIDFYTSGVMIGMYVCILFFLFLAYGVQNHLKNNIVILFDLLYEKVYAFYGDILGEETQKSIKLYVVTLFFVLFIINILSVILDFIAPIFGISQAGDFFLASYITMPTSDVQFNTALSLFSVLLLLYVQFGTLGFKKFVYSYVPVWGKGYITLERGKFSNLVYYPLKAFTKIADIIISLFLGFLDIVGTLAKVISLSFRLFGNMTSGTVLLGMLIVGISSFSQGITEFIGGINFPVLLPIIVYAQGLLVAVIQAMVFPLLVAIFIRMAEMEA